MAPDHDRTVLTDHERHVVAELEAMLAVEEGRRHRPRPRLALRRPLILPFVRPVYAVLGVLLGAVVVVATVLVAVPLAFAATLLMALSAFLGLRSAVPGAR